MKKPKPERHPPKFKTTFLKRRAPDDPRLEALKSWCGVFHRSGLAPSYGLGSHGNLSFRVKPGGNRFIITASAIRLKNRLTRRCFFEVNRADLRTNTVSGAGVRRPSSESLMHEAIYRKRRDIHAIFHGHCPQILARAARLGIPETPEELPYGTAALAESVSAALAGGFFAVMKNHGFVCLGKDLDDAGARAVEMLGKALEKS
ncbi:MAG: class II aldolase/adducin family protein [Candidatus Omnitrophica bacterium]|nr:class II aldolase/adducin family protein [Candidatus Omnitrophota bacterium]